MHSPPYVTLSYDGMQGDREFVVACKGRPFSILTSPNFPTPAITLIDFNLVRDLKLRMTEFQCAKFQYGGQKLRILGKISTSAQCIENGAQAGNIHIKATVVQDLYLHFDTHSIAGSKLSQKLIGPAFQLSPDISLSEPTAKTPERKRKKKASSPSSSTSSQSPLPPNLHPWAYRAPTLHQIRTQTPPSPLSPGFSPPFSKQVRTLSPSPSRNYDFRRTDSPPPGFPSTIYSPTKLPSSLPMPDDTTGMSPLSINISRLMHNFGSADLMSSNSQKRSFLGRCDQGATFEMGDDGESFNFFSSRAVDSSPSIIHGPVYKSGHGRTDCSLSCRKRDDDHPPPHNCGHHPQWQLPAGFTHCGYECKGGLCTCLRNYNSYGDYGYYG